MKKLIQLILLFPLIINAQSLVVYEGPNALAWIVDYDTNSQEMSLDLL